MATTVTRYNALLVGMTILVAASSLWFNRHQIAEDRLAKERHLLAGFVQQQVAKHAQAAVSPDNAATANDLAEIIHDHVVPLGVAAFGAVLDKNGLVVAGTGLTNDVRQAIEAAAAEGIRSMTESSRFVLLPVSLGNGTRGILGLDKEALAAEIWPVTSNTALFVAGALVLLYFSAFTALRHWIIDPMVRFLDSHIGQAVSEMTSSALPQTIDRNGFSVLPKELSENIERNLTALRVWARHKANLDRFIAVSTAENNKEQLARNLYTVLAAELPMKNLRLLELSASDNRFKVAYEAQGPTCPEALLSDPHRCFAYKSGRGVAQTIGEMVCEHCACDHEDVLICKPLVAAGKTIGTCRVTLDRWRLNHDLANAGHQNPIAVAETILDTYMYLTSLSLNNLSLLASYKNQAITDGLTGLYNRRYMVEYLAGLLSIAKRSNKPLSIFMVDIDNFKRLNDEYGHGIGDQVLQSVARAMRRAIRDCDVIARYGGEEFVVTVPEADGAEAIDVAERLRLAVADIEWDSLGLGNIPQVTVSVGVAEFPLHGYSHYHLTNAADKALYAAKRNGKNRVVKHVAVPADLLRQD